MTDDQINAAIAEACGWKPKRQTKLTRTGHFKVSYENPPNYCSDLNAMHEAEHTLAYIQLCNYIDLLIEFSPEAAVATARQRAESFLRTLGKWEATTEESSAVQKEALE